MSQGSAVGVIRVSEIGKRELERVASPGTQRDRIVQEAARVNRDVYEIYPEVDVSGGSPLAKRPGLRLAIEAIEAGYADTLIVAYFDRLVRSLRVQEEVVNRVEAAGGRVLAADVGQVTSGTASQWLSSTMLGMVAEYTRRSTAERTIAAQDRAVREGRVPFPLIPGFRRAADGTVEVDPVAAPVVKRAFEMRADGSSLREIRAYLLEHGIYRASLNSHAMMFRNRMVIGEVHYRGWLGACPRLIGDELWERVERATGARRGRYTKSPRLLARLGVLKCACGGLMSASAKGSGRSRQQPFYRCTAVDCSRRATVGAKKVETLVLDEVKAKARGRAGHWSGASVVAEAQALAERDRAALRRAMKAFTAAGLADDPDGAEQLAALKSAADTSRAAAERALKNASTVEITLAKDEADVCFAEWRDVISALVDHVSVRPGDTPHRIKIIWARSPLAEPSRDSIEHAL